MTSQRKKKGLYDVKKHLYQRVQRTILGLNQAFEANHNTDYKRVKKNSTNLHSSIGRYHPGSSKGRPVTDATV